MSYDFLPNVKQQSTPKPNTQSGFGGAFSVGKNHFFDQYLNHFDAHKLFSLPPKREQFKLKKNFDYVVNEIFSEQKIKSFIKSNFYGPNTDYEMLLNGYTEFQNITLLNNAIEKSNLKTNDLFSGIEKPKMKINDRFGMFSFDLASMAMTYVYEYYDKKNNILDVNDVEKMGAKFISRTTNEEVYQRIKRRENGTPVVVSSVRNSLIDFDKKEKEKKAVEILVNVRFASNERIEETLYNSLAAMVVAQKLISIGFQVKITAIVSIQDDKENNYFHFIPAKNYNENFDKNAVAYVCGDPRFRRFQGFKILIKGYDDLLINTPKGIGFGVGDISEIETIIEKEYVPNSNLKQANARLYFGGARNQSDFEAELRLAERKINNQYGNNN